MLTSEPALQPLVPFTTNLRREGRQWEPTEGAVAEGLGGQWLVKDQMWFVLTGSLASLIYKGKPKLSLTTTLGICIQLRRSDKYYSLLEGVIAENLF